MNSEIKNSRISAGGIITGTVIFSIIYVILRYHIFGKVLWKDFPFFVLNKGISLSAFILLTYNFTFGPLKNLGVNVPTNWLKGRNVLGMTGFLLIVIHVLMSYLIFNPTVYSKFFEADGSLTLLAGLSMLGGVLGFVVLWAYNLSFQTNLRENKAFISFITSKKFLMWALTLGAIHLFFMGYKGWMQPSDWNGGMPPVSFVAFTFFFLGYIINVFGRK